MGPLNTYSSVEAANRKKRKTLYVLAALYVFIGLGLAIVFAVIGDPLGAFLGFLIVNGTIAATALFHAIWRLNGQAAGLADRLDSLSVSTAELRSALEKRASAEDDSEGEVQSVDLSTMGRGDPSLLTAAVLDRSAYPRLAGRIPPVEDGLKPDRDGPEASVEQENPANLSLLRRWKQGLRERDLATCREVFSALVELMDDDTAARMKDQLQDLEHRVERRLRETFQQQIREHALHEAEATGEEISRLFPEQPVAAEYARIKPLLRRAAEEHNRTSAAR